MPDPQKDKDKDKEKDDALEENIGKLSKGLNALKEVWNFSNRVAALREKHKGEAVPVGELFSAMLGMGDQPNPLAIVEQQLAEINVKLDRVLAGIEEIKVGQIGQGVLAAYLDMSDPAYLVEKYFQDLASYQDGVHPWTEAERKEFVDKLLGARSERDSVAFCAHKLVKLSPITQVPLLFELLFPYLSATATAANARETYLKGAYAFRSLAEMLNKALILESFAIASAGGTPAKVAARMSKATEKYRWWIRAMAENSFLPFAEKLATFDFVNEYLGGHDTDATKDAHLPLIDWQPAKHSILQSADELAAKLMGKSRSVTLRVIPNVPPIADSVRARSTTGAAGEGWWKVETRPTTSLTRETLLDKIEASRKHFFELTYPMIGGVTPAESVRKVEIEIANGAKIPEVGFDKKRLSFLRYQFNLTAPLSDGRELPDGVEFQIGWDNRMAVKEFPELSMKWKHWQVESGQSFGGEVKTLQYPFVSKPVTTHFKLPQVEGQLSPVLITYAYQLFAPFRPK